MGVVVKKQLPITDYVSGLGNVTIVRKPGTTELFIEENPADNSLDEEAHGSVRQCLERYVEQRRETLKRLTEEVEVFERVIERLRQQGG